MSSFVSETILNLAGIKLDSSEGKFTFIDLEQIENVNHDESPADDINSHKNTVGNDTNICHKKKKPKRRKNDTKTISSKKTVRFSFVEEIIFDRDVGLHCVPTKGSFPLGLGKFICREIKNIPETNNSESSNTVPLIKTRGSVTKIKDIVDTNIVAEGHSFLPKSEKERFALIANPSNFEESFKEIEKDLSYIRENRNFNGCLCKPIKADKLSVVKLKHELLNNPLNSNEALTEIEVDKLSKTQLLHKVKEMLKSCSLCINNQCECVANEIACSMEACGCIRKLSQSFKSSGDEKFAQSCANNYGKILFDLDRVKNYRQKILVSINPETLLSSLNLEI